MRLHDPWLLLLAPLLLWWLRRLRALPRSAVRFPLVADLRAAGQGRRGRWLRILPYLAWAAAFLLVGALARPQRGRAAAPLYTEGIDIALVVDVSGSMLAEDFTLDGRRVSRLDAVKDVVRQFVRRRAGDRLTLVLFAGRPYTQCPLTLDHAWLLRNLERAEVGMIEDGTAIGSALATAVRRLESSTAKSRIVILLTDGQNNAGRISPLAAADAAAELGYRVYTIGAGTRGVAPYPDRDLFGRKIYRPMPVDIDEETLRRIAERTGGRYFRATDTERLEEIYREIDALEKSGHEAVEFADYEELYVWLAAAAFGLLAGELLLRQTWLRTLP